MERGNGEEENQVSTVISFFLSIIPSGFIFFQYTFWLHYRDSEFVG